MSVPDIENKEHEKHLELAATVKNVHAKLRQEYKECGDFETAWRKHNENHEMLSEYATAMHQLATDHWTKRPETRIDWCRRLCLEYFYDGGLQRMLDKDQRRALYHRERGGIGQPYVPHIASSMDTQEMQATPAIHISDTTEGGATAVMGGDDVDVVAEDLRDVDNMDLLCADKSNLYGSNVCLSGGTDEDKDELDDVSLYVDGEEGEKSDNEGEDEEEDQCSVGDGLNEDLGEAQKQLYEKYPLPDYHVISHPFTNKIRLLDVGSCYNPFGSYEEFTSIAIDISPAVEDVYKCDFLSVQLTEPLQLASDTMRTFLRQTSHSRIDNTITCLPRSLCHVVVFSLLLEYFPSHYQRWLCCQKAHQLLALNGLLLIITPDSHHINKNAPQMKSWKQAIESIGFTRYCYEKQEHLHCMAFRKTTTELQDNLTVGMGTPEMLYIPQDFSNPLAEMEQISGILRTETEDESLRGYFDELPGYL